MSAPAQSQAAVHALDTLQAMMNLVFMQTGRIFSDPSSKSSSRSQGSLKKPIPFALERFHDSLDELETELLRAKMVLRRDLALFRAEREEKERAEAAERERIAAEANPPHQAATSTVEPSEKSETNDTRQYVDVDMTNDSAEAISRTDSASNNRFKLPDAQEQVNEQLVLSTDLNEQVENEAERPASNDQNIDDLFEKTPTTAGVKDLNFDNIFDDLPSSSPPDKFNESASLSDNFNFPLPDDSNGVNSLLSGIESYANNDNIDYDALDTTSGLKQNPISSQKPSEDQDANAADSFTGDNFGDLFDFGDGGNSQEENEFNDAMWGFQA